MSIRLHAGLSTSRPRQRGFALVFVLWAVVFLTLLAGNYVLNVRAESVMVSNVVENARADALAEAAVQHGLLSLLTQGPRSAARQGSRQYEASFGGGTIRVSIVPESAKIDINTAPERLIVSLMERMEAMEDGPSAEERQRAAAAILDWRDRDNRLRPQGAEDSAYSAARMQYDAADNPFLMVEELARVLGVDDRIYSYMKPLVTVNSRQGKVHAASASREVLLALPGVSEAEVDEYLAERAQAEPGGGPTRGVPPQLQSARASLTRASRPIFSISGEGETAGGTKARRSAVVRITRNKRRPYLIVNWSDDVGEFFQHDMLHEAADGSTADRSG